jgi:hypothetical protein
MIAKKRVTEKGAAPNGANLSYDEIAKVINAALDTINSVIPGRPLGNDQTIAYVRRRLGVSPQMIARAITTAEVSPKCQNFIDVPDALDALALRTALRPVFDRMNALAQDLKFAIDIRLVKTGGEALDVYAAAKRAARGTDGALVASHLRSMVEAMPKGKGNRRRKAPPETPLPAGPTEDK